MTSLFIVNCWNKFKSLARYIIYYYIKFVVKLWQDKTKHLLPTNDWIWEDQSQWSSLFQGQGVPSYESWHISSHFLMQ